MKLYRYLDCENLEIIQNKIYDYLKDVEKVLDKKTYAGLPTTQIIDDIPELKSFLENLNLGAFMVGVHILYQSGTIHLEHPILRGPRIIFPIKNGEKSQTNIYECTNLKQEIRNNNNGFAYVHISYDEYKVIDSYVATKPVLFYPIEPHQIVVPDGPLEHPRIMLILFLEGVQPYRLIEEAN